MRFLMSTDVDEVAVTERCCRGGEQSSEVFDCAFHPRDPILACGLRDRVQIFRGRNHTQPFARWESDELDAETASPIIALSWSPDGARLAAGCLDGRVFAWHFLRDCPAKSESAQHHPIAVFAIAWNRWSRHLFASRSRDQGTKQRIIAWNFSDDLIIEQTFELDTKLVLDIQWVSDVRLAACSFEGEIHIFNVHKPIAIQRLSQPGVRAIQWQYASHLLASCAIDGSIKVWSMKDYANVQEFKWEDAAACSIDCFGHRTGRYSLIACGFDDGSIVTWCLTDDSAYQLNGHVDAVTSLKFSPDGKFLASVDPEEKIVVWSTMDWQLKCEYFKQSQVEWNKLAWSTDSRKLAIATRTEKVLVIDVLG